MKNQPRKEILLTVFLFFFGCMADPCTTSNDTRPRIHIEGLKGLLLNTEAPLRFEARSSEVQENSWHLDNPRFDTGKQQRISANHAQMENGHWILEGDVRIDNSNGEMHADRLKTIETKQVLMQEITYSNQEITLHAKEGTWDEKARELRLTDVHLSNHPIKKK